MSMFSKMNMMMRKMNSYVMFFVLGLPAEFYITLPMMSSSVYDPNINMNLSLMLFLMGVLGFVLNSKNIMLMLMSIEMMLLAITFLMLIASFNFDDMLGQMYATYIMSMAGAESAIGLGMLVAFYSLSGSVAMEFK